LEDARNETKSTHSSHDTFDFVSMAYDGTIGRLEADKFKTGTNSLPAHGARWCPGTRRYPADTHPYTGRTVVFFKVLGVA
jgi:hypothetical protein